MPWALAVIDGESRGRRFSLTSAGLTLGRNRGALLFREDRFMSSPHASIHFAGAGRPMLRDESSSSGVYLAISGETPLSVGELFCAGQRLFRYRGAINLESGTQAAGQARHHGAPLPVTPDQALYVIEEQLQGLRPGKSIAAPGPLLSLGSSRECTLAFTGDETLAARHCELHLPKGEGPAILVDLSQGRGTFVRIAPGVDRELTTGDRFRVGGQVLELQPA